MLTKNKSMSTAVAVAVVIVSLLLTLVTLWLMLSSGEPGKENTPTAAEEKGIFRLLITAEDRTSGLCDVMMLASFDRDAGSVSVLQLPRDTYADFGKETYRKLNGAPAHLGRKEFCAWMGEQLGISIDRYVHLSPDGFCRMVDALGGVELTLEEPLRYHDPEQNLTIDLPVGKQILNGKQAEGFVRYRSGYVRGDLGRMDAQKIFLAALAQKAAQTRSPLALVRLASAVLAETETDLTFSDLCALCDEILEVRQEDMLFVTAPGADAVGGDGGSYYVLSAPSMEELLSSCFGGTESGFDLKGVFRHPQAFGFQRIYQMWCDYRIYRADEVVEQGIRIPTAG